MFAALSFPPTDLYSQFLAIFKFCITRLLFTAMDPEHNFGQIRLHLSRALFHLNHLATLIPFFVIDEDAPEPPPVGFGRHLVRWPEMGPRTTPTSSSSRTLITHGQLPSLSLIHI